MIIASNDQFVLELLRREASDREALHAGHTSSRPLSEGYEHVGIVGEFKFSRVYRLPFDWDRKPMGDGGVDFTIPLCFTVDVKTARKANHLLVEVGKVSADIYVLAQYIDPDDAEFLGWEWASAVASAPTKTFGTSTIVNHYIHREKLRPMSSLDRRIVRLCG